MALHLPVATAVAAAAAALEGGRRVAGTASAATAATSSLVQHGREGLSRRTGGDWQEWQMGLSTLRTGCSTSGRGGSSNLRARAVVRAVVDNSQRSEQKQRARLAASKVEKHLIKEAERPLAEYMSLPASQYSVLDAERIERVDESSFRCYAPRLKFFSFEVRPVLLVRVEEQQNGCCIRLLSCTLEGSPIVMAQNKKFTASMVNNVSWREIEDSPAEKELISDTTIEVTLDIPGAVSVIPRDMIEGTGGQVLGQVLRVMLPRFLSQLGKDYHAWASGDTTRKPLGTGTL